MSSQILVESSSSICFSPARIQFKSIWVKLLSDKSNLLSRLCGKLHQKLSVRHLLKVCVLFVEYVSMITVYNAK